jgi:hypothetical protein
MRRLLSPNCSRPPLGGVPATPQSPGARYYAPQRVARNAAPRTTWGAK